MNKKYLFSIGIILILFCVYIIFVINIQPNTNKEFLAIPTNGEQPAYVITEISFATNKDGGDIFNGKGIMEGDCVYILKSVIHGEVKGFDAFYNKLKLYRGCNNLQIGDTLYFAPIIKNYN